MKIMLRCFLLLTMSSTQAIGQGWTNPEDPLDVNADTNVWFDDTLAIVNWISSGGPSVLPAIGDPPPYYDVSSDGFLSPLDFLMIANELNPIANLTPPSDLPVAHDGEGEIRLAIVDPAGNAIDSVNVGEGFVLQAYVSDTDSTGTGAYAAYFDLSYDSTRVGFVTGSERFDDLYSFGRSGVSGDGFENIGATYGDLDAPNRAESMLYSVEFEATQVGVAEFTVGGDATMLLFGVDGKVPSVISNSVSISVVPEPCSSQLTALLAVVFVTRVIRRSK